MLKKYNKNTVTNANTSYKIDSTELKNNKQLVRHNSKQCIADQDASHIQSHNQDTSTSPSNNTLWDKKLVNWIDDDQNMSLPEQKNIQVQAEYNNLTDSVQSFQAASQATVIGVIKSIPFLLKNSLRAVRSVIWTAETEDKLNHQTFSPFDEIDKYSEVKVETNDRATDNFTTEKWINQELNLNQQDQYDALACFSQVSSIDQTSLAWYWYYQGLTLQRLEKNYEALQAFDQAINIEPNNDEFWYYKGLNLLKLEQNYKALQSLVKAIKLNPYDEDYWFYQSIALWDLGKQREALEAITKAISLDQENDNFCYFKGIILFNLDRNHLALIDFTKAIKLNSKIGEYWYYQGLTLSRLERKVEALASLENAIIIEPDNKQYKKAIDNICYALT